MRFSKDRSGADTVAPSCGGPDAYFFRNSLLARSASSRLMRPSPSASRRRKSSGRPQELARRNVAVVVAVHFVKPQKAGAWPQPK